METIIYMVRHAESPYRSGEEETRGLSERGCADAEAVCERLRHERIDAVVSSPYARAIQTLRPLAERLGLQLELDAGFRERQLADAGCAPGNFMSAIEKVFADPGFSFPGGESNQAAQERGVAALRRIFAKYPGKRVAIGTHGNMMTLIMNYYDSRYDVHFWKRMTMPDIYKLTFVEETLIDAVRLWG